MPDERPPTPRRISRRDLLKTAAVAGVAAAVPAQMLGPGRTAGAAEAFLQTAPVAAVREPLETLTAAESDILEAIVARLIPSDENGPGAAEARAAHYIDRALTGPLASSRDAYRAGLAASDAYAQATKGARFAQLSAGDQDAVLTEMERNIATGFTPSAAAFFNLVRSHTIQGTFCDPYYGGNANFVGWDLVGYPGVRTAVSADEQQRLTDGTLTANHRSAYDYEAFTKSPARRASGGDGNHGR